MSDLISRQAAIDAVKKLVEWYKEKWHESRPSSESVIDVLNDLPSAQSERKRGEWRHYEGYLTCSECGTEYDDDIMTHCCDDVPKYCPNCGADMRGEQDVNVR